MFQLWTAIEHFYTIKSYLYSILYNLIANALKYRAQERKPLITLTTFRTTDAHGFVITDNGMGIDLATHRERVFNMYQRFHVEGDGKGLGLFLVKTQVSALNGTIEIESQVDKGTSFVIGFPGPGNP